MIVFLPKKKNANIFKTAYKKLSLNKFTCKSYYDVKGPLGPGCA